MSGHVKPVVKLVYERLVVLQGEPRVATVESFSLFIVLSLSKKEKSSWTPCSFRVSLSRPGVVEVGRGRDPTYGGRGQVPNGVGRDYGVSLRSISRVGTPTTDCGVGVTDRVTVKTGP